MKATLVDKFLQKERQYPLGFNWWMLIFHYWTAFARWDFLGFFFLLVVPELLNGLWNGIEFRFYLNPQVSQSFIFVLGTFITVLAPFLYNRIWIYRLLRKGWQPSTAKDKDLLVQENYLSENGDLLSIFQKPRRQNYRDLLLLIVIYVGFTLIFFIFGGLLNGGAFQPRFEIIYPLNNIFPLLIILF